MEIYKKNNFRNKKGFTLIELLIVIAIIGILASVVLVSLSSAREKAKVASFKAQAHAIQTKAVSECDSQALSVAVLGNNQAGYNITGISGNCTITGNGTFTVTIASRLLSTACTATANIQGVSYSGC